MDHFEAEPIELGRSLADLRWVNRWLGGRAQAIRLILGLASELGKRKVTILDIGTGSADLPLALVRAARKRGITMRITATDLHPLTIEYARAATFGEPGIEVREANAFALPFESGEFDLAMSCTTLHHFDDDEAITALGEMNRVARHGVVVTDLARSRLALVGARLLAATLWRRHPITRHDGPASVRSAFTSGELADLARAAGGTPFRLRKELLFRQSLVFDRTKAATLPAGVRG